MRVLAVSLRPRRWDAANDAYPFQIPLEGKSGPIVQADGHEMLMLSSYDYLGLIGDPRVNEAAIEAVKKYGTGTGGARLLTGTLDLHRQLERDVAEFKGTEDAITFSSGYLANIAVITSMLGPADRVIADSLSHRSLLDACRMAGVQIQRFRHNDPVSLRQEIQNGSYRQSHAHHFRRRFLDGWRHLHPAGADRDQEGVRLLPADG